MDFVTELLTASIRVSTPIILVALGGCFSEQAGVFAMGLEGFMLSAAFAGVVGTILSGNLIIGILVGVLAGTLVSLLLAVSTIKFGGEQVLSGLALNMIILGATGFLQRLLWGTSGVPIIQGINPVRVPLLADIPILGPILFNQPPLTYLAYGLIPLAWWIMYKSRWGLELRAVGENPKAVDTVGLNVSRIRILAVVFSGVLAGLGGAVLSLQQVHTFTEGMTAGRGWLGLIAAIFGRWNPIAAAGAAFLFGAADALQMRLQITGSIQISSYFVLMLPHLLALILIAVVGKAARYPAATGVVYTKE